MKTPLEYIENKYPIIPCYKNERRPIGEKWEDKPTGQLDRFNPGDNIGIHLLGYIDIDVDNIVCHKFLKKIKTLGCAVLELLLECMVFFSQLNQTRPFLHLHK